MLDGKACGRPLCACVATRAREAYAPRTAVGSAPRSETSDALRTYTLGSRPIGSAQNRGSARTRCVPRLIRVRAVKCLNAGREWRRRQKRRVFVQYAAVKVEKSQWAAALKRAGARAGRMETAASSTVHAAL
eukprot:4510719-Pleurochrysis_carterae.AAC.4